MSAIPTNKLSLITIPVVLAKTTLTASDTLTFDPMTDQILYLHNITGLAVTVTIDGDTGTTVPVPDTGETFDVATGKEIPLAADDLVAVRLASISAYLSGTVSITGGLGVSAWITTNY